MRDFNYILFVGLLLSGCASDYSRPLRFGHIDQLEIAAKSQSNAKKQFDWVLVDDDPYGKFTIYFDYDDDQIRSHQKQNLKKVVGYAYEIINRGETVVVEGHAGLHGKKQWYQEHIAKRRAQSVARALVKHGIPKKRIKIFSRGQEMPAHLVPERTPDQQGSNRRVEVYGIAD